MTKTNRKILRIVLAVSVACVLLIAGLLLSVAARPWPETPIDYDDPESLWQLAQRTEQYIIRNGASGHVSSSIGELFRGVEVVLRGRSRLEPPRFPARILVRFHGGNDQGASVQHKKRMDHVHYVAAPPVMNPENRTLSR